MKPFSRDFSLKEKILLLFLVIVLVGLMYYKFVDSPVREGLAEAASQKAALEVELEAVQARITLLERMKNELESITANGTLKQMPSYNNNKNVNKLLNDTLGDMDYSILFKNVSAPTGNLVRRNILVSFDAPSYEEVRRVLADLTGCEYRCLIGDVRCTTVYALRTNEFQGVTVTVSLTFYETMVGGEADSGLPSAK